MSTITSLNPSTRELTEGVAEVTTPAGVAEVAEEAASAAARFESSGRSFRARFLRAISTELENRREDIIALAHRETAIPITRLEGELNRTTYQARFFADVLDEGSYLEATIDHAAETPMGAGPDLRRMLVPLGPVAVFGASNFPLAFSVPGGDTVSALAAGNPVVVKAHSSHPALSRLCFEAIRSAAESVGAPTGVIGIVFGTAAGAALVANPSIRAVGFTGSLGGGRALMDIIAKRDEPIPFYGELSSLNPLIVTRAAAAARGSEIAEGLAAAVTVSAGQLCTKPGAIFVPRGQEGDALTVRIRELILKVPAAALLNERISSSYTELQDKVAALPHVSVLAHGQPAGTEGLFVSPRVVEVDAADIDGSELEECFGPSTVVVRYEDASLRRGLGLLPASLTATIHAEADETEAVQDLTGFLRNRAGRLIYNQYPTGVLVTWAQHHGGPWPSTNTLHTSVGATSIRRFLRPMTWQNAPESVLPGELKDRPSNIVRRVDGRLALPV